MHHREPGWPHREFHYKTAQMVDQWFDGGARVLILGNSAAAHGLDPGVFTRRLGMATYNAGVASLHMVGIAYWARHFVLPLLGPDIVVMSSGTFTMNDLGEVGDERLEQLKCSRPMIDVRRVIRATTRRVRASASGRLRELVRPAPSALAAIIDPRGGRWFDPAHEVYSDPPGARVSGVFDPYAVGGPQRSAFVRFARSMTDRGIELVVVDMPHSIDYPPKHPRGQADVDRYRSDLAATAAMSGVRLISLQELFTSKTMFRDSAHLSPLGRTMLSNLVVDELRR